eukprot:scaffold2204_cov166-Amphora_coffeaeformis.AAC.33
MPIIHKRIRRSPSVDPFVQFQSRDNVRSSWVRQRPHSCTVKHVAHPVFSRTAPVVIAMSLALGCLSPSQRMQ